MIGRQLSQAAQGPHEIQREPCPPDRAGARQANAQLPRIELRPEQARAQVHQVQSGDEARLSARVDVLHDPETSPVSGERAVQVVDGFRQGLERRIELGGELFEMWFATQPPRRGVRLHARSHRRIIVVGLLQPEESRDATVGFVGVRGDGDRLQRKPGEARQSRQPVPVVAGAVDVTDKHPWGHVRRETVATE